MPTFSSQKHGMQGYISTYLKSLDLDHPMHLNETHILKIEIPSLRPFMWLDMQADIQTLSYKAEFRIAFLSSSKIN